MDFPMQRLVVEALNEKEAWDTGLVKIYEGLANDFHYPSPEDLMVFPDNHDMDRIHTQLKEDPLLTRMAVTYLLSLPRIPQIYYGTEILMQNSAKPGDHGLIRTDFPGGWEGDPVNAFTGEGLSTDQKEMQDYLRKLLNYRKSSKAIHHGKTKHFAPEQGVYVIFRYQGDETVAVFLNKNDEPVELDLERYREMGLEGKEVENVWTGEKFTWKDRLQLNKRGVIVLTTKH
jgi:glycosidase